MVFLKITEVFFVVKIVLYCSGSLVNVDLELFKITFKDFDSLCY